MPTKEGFAELVEALGKSCEEVALPPLFDKASGARADDSAGRHRAPLSQLP